MKTVRVSAGSAVRLGLQSGKIDCLPTTIYLMTPGRCRAGCHFCSQLVSEDRLSRVTWPEYPLEDVVSALHDERICLQCLNYGTVLSDVLELTDWFTSHPISVSAQPFSRDEIQSLSHRVDRIAINMDCATPELFAKIKPYYNWEDHLSRLMEAVDIFGPFRVTSHLIGGLGETEEQMVNFMTFLYDHSIYSSLFAFTPIEGTPLAHLPRPSITYYRRLQVAHYCIYKGMGNFGFEHGKIKNLPQGVPPEAFMTRGCPGCNRPYYTETPRNPYNFPCKPTEDDMNIIGDQLTRCC
ncbi:MAG: radical SAM protein [Theionarchaea archaeon]|nr:radical SAM protein [Theionarchaea archaeon]